MKDALVICIQKHWSSYGRSDACDVAQLSFTKFCQRIVQPHTKVLYYVTYAGVPLCIIKIIRSPQYSTTLSRECVYQKQAPIVGVLSVPRVFWSDVIEGRFVYAEEVIDAMQISRDDFRALATDVVIFSKALPHEGQFYSHEFARMLRAHVPADPAIERHIATLERLRIPLELGLTHGDMGRPNILGTRERAWVIDWERAGDIPFRYFDSALYVRRVYRQSPAVRASVLAKLVVCDEAYADLLLLLTDLYTLLYRIYPNVYRNIVQNSQWKSV